MRNINMMNLNEAKRILNKSGYILNENLYIGKEGQFYKIKNWYASEIEKYLKKWQDEGIDVEFYPFRLDTYFVTGYTVKQDGNEYRIKTYRMNLTNNPKIVNNQYIDDPWDGWKKDEVGKWYAEIDVLNLPIERIEISGDELKPNMTEFEWVDSIIGNLGEYCNIDNTAFAEFYDKLETLLDKYKQYGFDCKIDNYKGGYGEVTFSLSKKYTDDSSRYAKVLKDNVFDKKVKFTYMFDKEYNIILNGYAIFNGTNWTYYDGDHNKDKDAHKYNLAKVFDKTLGKKAFTENEFFEFIKEVIFNVYKDFINASFKTHDISSIINARKRRERRDTAPKLLSWIKSFSGEDFIKAINTIIAQRQIGKLELHLYNTLADLAEKNKCTIDPDYATTDILTIAEDNDYDSVTDFLKDNDIIDYKSLVDYLYSYNYDDGIIKEDDLSEYY